MTITEFYSQLSDLTIYKFNSVDNSKKVRYLNRAILNLFKDLKYYCPDVYEKEATLTAADGVITFPSDFNYDDRNDLLLFGDVNRTQIVSPTNYRAFGGSIRTMKGDTSTYYLEYTASPSVYTDMSDELLEASNRRVFEMLQTEIEYIRDTDISQGQTSAQAQAARIRTNELS